MDLVYSQGDKITGNTRPVVTNGNTIYNQELIYDGGICSYLNQIIEPLSGVDKNSDALNSNGFTFSQNRFIQTKSTVTDVLQECKEYPINLNKGSIAFLFKNHFEQPLVLSGISGEIRSAGNYYPYLHYSSSRFGSINLSGDTTKATITFSNVQNNSIQLYSNIFTSDTARIDVMYSKVNQVYIGGNEAKVVDIYFHWDTLGFVNVSTELVNKHTENKIRVVYFFRTHLTDFITTDINPDTTHIGKMEFFQCSFAPNVYLAEINVDTLRFTRCLDLSKGTILRALQRNKPMILQFDHSDLTNLDFDYDERYQLFRWPSDDVTRSVFEQLLVKFQNEKKLDSYKRVDIEYFKFRNNRFVNIVSHLWWNYGYEKWWIVLWTMFLLTLFSILNTIFWNDFRRTYHEEKESEITSTPPAKRFFKILLYTSLIFFSLRINFEKLSFKKTGWLIYFFIQYTVGLVCLFFIANAILKLG